MNPEMEDIKQKYHDFLKQWGHILGTSRKGKKDRKSTRKAKTSKLNGLKGGRPRTNVWVEKPDAPGVYWNPFTGKVKTIKEKK